MSRHIDALRPLCVLQYDMCRRLTAKPEPTEAVPENKGESLSGAGLAFDDLPPQKAQLLVLAYPQPVGADTVEKKEAADADQGDLETAAHSKTTVLHIPPAAGPSHVRTATGHTPTAAKRGKRHEVVPMKAKRGNTYLGPPSPSLKNESDSND